MRHVSLLFHDVYVRDPRESGFSSRAADRYKLSAAEFEGQLRGLQSLVSGLSSNSDQRPKTIDQRPFTITVDDGGVSYYTQVADRLEALGWRGYCFVTTDCIGQAGFLTAGQIRELDARGHVIGSHTASHPYRFHTCTPDRMREEWTRSRARLEELLGHTVTVASVPGGFFSRAVARAAEDAGITMLYTSEPLARVWREGACTLAGRFALRAGCAPTTAARFVGLSPWTRCREWTSWNVKGLVKPVLGQSYARVADWVSARTPSQL
jgi:peptidoglycan/xylan/chitin deacetylase (PgdA/CDA1 family)